MGSGAVLTRAVHPVHAVAQVPSRKPAARWPAHVLQRRALSFRARTGRWDETRRGLPSAPFDDARIWPFAVLERTTLAGIGLGTSIQSTTQGLLPRLRQE